MRDERERGKRTGARCDSHDYAEGHSRREPTGAEQDAQPALGALTSGPLCAETAGDVPGGAQCPGTGASPATVHRRSPRPRASA
eukprot:244722-Heterocapsa_arctica.AAC.1